MSDNPPVEPVETSPEATPEDIAEQKLVRLAKRERLIAEGGEAYPVSLPITTTIPEVRAHYGALVADDVTGVTVGVAGRVVFSRNTGKLCFAALQAGSGERIQAMVSLAEVGEESIQRWKELVDLGDHVFVSGEVTLERACRPGRPRLRERRGHLFAAG